ncbi:MAG: NAD-dependent epimerase/dehydratase family protein [Micromonosporaceae bacterium]
MTTSSTVLLAGASGVFGRHVARALTAAGHHVLGLGRSASNEISADLMDRDAVLRAVRGHRADVVVHAATALRRPPLRHQALFATDDLRIEGTRNLVEAARLLGARRFIGENIVFGYGYRDHGERRLTEADPFGVPTGDRNVDRHLAGMREKEALPLAAGLDAVSLRFGLFYGEGGTDTVVEMLRRRRLPAVDDGGRTLPWVNLADAATAVLAAIERGRPGEEYNFVDASQLGFGGMLRAVATASGSPAPLTVPRWFTRLTPYAHMIMSVNMRVSAAKAKEELGWRPRFATVADGLRELAGHPR